MSGAHGPSGLATWDEHSGGSREENEIRMN